MKSHLYEKMEILFDAFTRSRVFNKNNLKILITLSTIHQTCGLLFSIRLITLNTNLIITKAQFEENYSSQIAPHIAIMFIE